MDRSQAQYWGFIDYERGMSPPGLGYILPEKPNSPMPRVRPGKATRYEDGKPTGTIYLRYDDSGLLLSDSTPEADGTSIITHYGYAGLPSRLHDYAYYFPLWYIPTITRYTRRVRSVDTTYQIQRTLDMRYPYWQVRTCTTTYNYGYKSVKAYAFQLRRDVLGRVDSIVSSSESYNIKHGIRDFFRSEPILSRRLYYSTSADSLPSRILCYYNGTHRVQFYIDSIQYFKYGIKSFVERVGDYRSDSIIDTSRYWTEIAGNTVRNRFVSFGKSDPRVLEDRTYIFHNSGYAFYYKSSISDCFEIIFDDQSFSRLFRLDHSFLWYELAVQWDNSLGMIPVHVLKYGRKGALLVDSVEDVSWRYSEHRLFSDRGQIPVADVPQTYIWPNPVLEGDAINFYRDDDQTAPLAYALINPSGKIIQQGELVRQNLYQIQFVRPLPPGVYTLSLFYPDKQERRRFVVQGK